MKYFLLVIITVLCTSVSSQKDFSNFFILLDNLDTTNSFEGFSESERGYYLISEMERRQMMVTLDNMEVRTGFEVVLSSADAKSKGYEFEDNKMYGMAPLNGVFYVEENDTIYALYYQNDNYLDLENQTIVKSDDQSYFVFTNDQDDYFSVEFISFSETELSIKSIDHMPLMDEIGKTTKVKSKKINKLKSYLITPTLAELQALVENNCFNDIRTFSKLEKL